MRWMKPALAIFCLLIASLPLGCEKDSSSNPVVPTPTSPFEISQSTKFPENLTGLLSVDVKPDQLVFTFSTVSQLPSYSSGDILVGKTGGGYLRKVATTVQTGSSLVVTTVQASLEEVINKGSIDTTFELNPSLGKMGKLFGNQSRRIRFPQSHATSIAYDQPIVSISGNVLSLRFPNASISVTDQKTGGSIEIVAETLGIDFSARVKNLVAEWNFGLKKFRFVEEIKLNIFFKGIDLDLTGPVDIDDSVRIIPNPISLGRIPFSIGPIPAWMTFQFDLFMGLEALFNITAGATGETSLQTGLTIDIGAEYANGSFSPVWDASASTSGQFDLHPTAGISAEVDFYVKPKIDCLVYESVGPGLYAKGYEYNKVSFPPLTGELGVGVAGGLDFSMTVFSKRVFDYQFQLLDKRWPFFSKTLGNLPPTAASQPSPPDHSLNQPNSLTLSWTPSTDPENDPINYDVYVDVVSPPIKRVAHNQTGTTCALAGLLYSKDYYWKVVAKDNQSNSTEGPLWQFGTAARINHPPNPPGSPSPANNAINQSTSLDLSWNCSDPDNDTLIYNVYLDISNPPQSMVAQNISDKSFGPVNLAIGTTYYWQVVVRDSYQATTLGPVWTFSTYSSSNRPPLPPSDPQPPDNSTTSLPNTRLQWNCYDPDGDPISYSLFFGTTNPPTQPLIQNQSSNTYDVQNLALATKYYWFVVATDDHLNSTRSPVWNFTTVSNTPPIASLIVKPSSGPISTLFVFDASGSYDAETPHDRLQYNFGYGWSTSSSTTFSTNVPGTYTATVDVRDEGGLISRATRQFTVTPATNQPPVASFKVDPTSGDVSTQFDVDASTSSDDNTPSSQLLVRWDWESDGNWDTPFSTQKTASHKYSTVGKKTITLEVKDGGGLTSTTSEDVYVIDSSIPNIISATGSVANLQLLTVGVYRGDVSINATIGNYQNVTQIQAFINGTYVLLDNGGGKYSGTWNNVTLIKDNINGQYEAILMVLVNGQIVDTKDLDLF